MPTVQQHIEGSEFLGQLIQLGARLDTLRVTVEEAYWSLLINPEPTPFDDVSPFRLNGTPDIERISKILPELGSSPICPEADDCFYDLCYFASGNRWTEGKDNGEALRTKAKSLSIAALWRAAAVMGMAHVAGVYDTRRQELAALVLEAVQ